MNKNVNVKRFFRTDYGRIVIVAGFVQAALVLLACDIVLFKAVLI